jgi:hypothetical protein
VIITGLGWIVGAVLDDARRASAAQVRSVIVTWLGRIVCSFSASPRKQIHCGEGGVECWRNAKGRVYTGKRHTRFARELLIRGKRCRSRRTDRRAPQQRTYQNRKLRFLHHDQSP